MEGIAEPSGEAGPTGRVRVVESLAERTTVEVSAERAGWLILTDNFYPGWRAEVNGRGSAILRANFLFRAVRIPEGESRVVFRYRPASLLIGAALSLAALAAGVAWTWMPRGMRA